MMNSDMQGIFSAQEPAVYGRNSREPRPNGRLESHYATLVRNHQAQQRRASTIASRQQKQPQYQFDSCVSPPAQGFSHTGGDHAPAALFLPQVSEGHDIQGQGYGELSPEAISEMHDDPFADGLDIGEFTASMQSIAADQELIDSTIRPASQSITSTPVQLPSGPKTVRQSTTRSVTPRPFTGAQRNLNVAAQSGAQQRQSPLVHCSHIIPPVPGGETCTEGFIRMLNVLPSAVDPVGNQENLPVASVTTPQAKTVLGKRMADTELNKSTENGSDDKKTVVRASDLNPARRRIFDIAISIFWMMIASQKGYVPEDLADKWAVESWYKALAKLQTTSNYVGDAVPTEAEIEMIKEWESWIRSRVKTVARTCVITAYNLWRVHKKDEEVSTINFNCQRVELLKKDNAFIYEDPSDIKKPGTLFRNAIILDVICQVWFNMRAKGSQQDGIEYAEYFGDKIPLETIALVVTAVECAIDEWASGAESAVKFDAKIYEPIYNHHLENLQKWERYSVTRTKAVEKLQIHLLETARAQAGISGMTNTGIRAGIEQDIFANNE